jgi:L-asparaginase
MKYLINSSKKGQKIVASVNFDKDLIVISTGGTFNKIYNPISGELDVDQASNAIKDIAQKWLCEFKLINIIGKDSLKMSDEDRKILVQTIQNQKAKKILIIHGTDTIDQSAKVVSAKIRDKIIVFVGAMVPFAIDEVEATANFALGVGFLQGEPKDGVYIAMHSIVKSWDKIIKDKEAGVFKETS